MAHFTTTKVSDLKRRLLVLGQGVYDIGFATQILCKNRSFFRGNETLQCSEVWGTIKPKLPTASGGHRPPAARDSLLPQPPSPPPSRLFRH